MIPIKKKITNRLTFKNGELITPKRGVEVEKKPDNELIVHWVNFQIRFQPRIKQMTAICYNDGLARLVTRQSIPNEPVSGLLILKDRPEYHLEKFVKWCGEHGIDTVRSKKPNRTYSLIGELTTDGVVQNVINDDGYPCRVVENATWVMIHYQFETVLFTRESIFKLEGIPLKRWYDKDKQTPA